MLIHAVTLKECLKLDQKYHEHAALTFTIMEQFLVHYS